MYVVLNEGTDSQRIDVVIDVYSDNSINNPERERRGSENGHEFRNIKADHKTGGNFCPIPKINRS